MRILTLMLLGVIGLGIFACDSRKAVPGTSTRELIVFVGNTEIARGSDVNGTLNLPVGEVRNLRVIRRITEDGSFEDTNITATTADFNVSDNAIATVSNDPGTEGVVTGVSVGSTELEIRHRGANPLNDDFAYIDINVSAP